MKFAFVVLSFCKRRKIHINFVLVIYSPFSVWILRFLAKAQYDKFI